MKKYLVAVCFILFSLVACSNSGDSTTYQDQEYKRQVEIYNEQAKMAAEQQVETKRQLKESAAQQDIAAKQLEISASQQERMRKLLDRWEKQADRFDAILDRWEKK